MKQLFSLIIFLDNLLEFKDELLQELKDVEEGKNLYDPYEDFNEMYNDTMNGDIDDV